MPGRTETNKQMWEVRSLGNISGQTLTKFFTLSMYFYNYTNEKIKISMDIFIDYDQD